MNYILRTKKIFEFYLRASIVVDIGIVIPTVFCLDGNKLLRLLKIMIPTKEI